MKLSKLPVNADEFKAMRDQLAVTPEGGAAMFVAALKLFTVNAEEGIKCLVMQREINDLMQSSSPNSYMGYALNNSEFSLLKSQLAKQKYLPDSYFAGALPANNYTIPDGEAELEITTNPYSGDPESGKVKVFVRSSGADTPQTCCYEQE
jgi:hypothetical protein